MTSRFFRIVKFAAVGAALILFVWLSSVIAIYAVSSGRVFRIQQQVIS